MRDLELWRKLAAGERWPQLTAQLEMLGREAPRRRAPFVGFAVAMLDDPDAAIRAAALGVLAATRGVPGLRLLVQGLDDDAPAVRHAAVNALRESAKAAPARWAHVVFHPREDVRRLALVDPPEGAQTLLAYLRADPACADAAASTAWPEQPLDLVFNLWGREMVSVAEAATQIARVGAPGLRAYLSRSDRRRAEHVEAWIEQGARASSVPTAVGVDVLDAWVEVVTAAGSEADAAWGHLLDAVSSPDEPQLRARTLVAVALHGARHGWDPRLAALCTVCDPTFLRFAWVPVSVRRAATEVLVRHRDRIRRVDPRLPPDLLGSPVVRTDDGAPDLPAAAAVAGLLGHRRLRALTDAFGEDAVIDGVRSDPRACAAVFGLPAETTQLWLLDRLRAVDSSAFAEAGAIAAGVWATHAPGQRDAWLQTLDADELVGLARALVELTADDRWTPPIMMLEVLVVALRDALATVVAGEGPVSPSALVDGFRGLLTAALCREPVPDAGALIVRELDRALAPRQFAALLDGQPTEVVRRLLTLLDEVVTVGAETAKAVAVALQDARTSRAADSVVERFVDRILRSAEATAVSRRPVVSAVHNLTAAERERIATCELAELGESLAPALAQPCRGLTEALARRPRPDRWHLEACVALLACIDGLADVARELERFGVDDPQFGYELHWGCITLWRGNELVPPLVDAWLCAWEDHLTAFGLWIEAHEGGVEETLRAALALPCGWVCRQIWVATAAVLQLRRYRARRRLKGIIDHHLPELLVDRLDGDLGPSAARMLMALHRSGVWVHAVAAVRDRVWTKAPDLVAETRHVLSPWMIFDGVPKKRGAAVEVRRALPEDERERIKVMTDLDALVDVCRSGRDRAVHEAALRLTELGEAGQLRLAALLSEDPPPKTAPILGESVALWTSPAAIRALGTVASDPSKPPHMRFVLALALAERGEAKWIDVAVDAAAAKSDVSWFTADDWDRLLRHTDDEGRLALALAGSVHPHAYNRAVAWLLQRPVSDKKALDALRRFLEQGTERPLEHRRAAARRLHETGDFSAMPVLLEDAFDPETDSPGFIFDHADRTEMTTIASAIVDAALFGSKPMCTERRAVELLRRLRPADRAAGYERILLDGVDDDARKEIVAERLPTARRATKLAEIADVFAWGVRRGRELTGRLFSVHMTGKRADFGYTPIHSQRIFVTPLPILRGDRHGRDIVEALVLHELGHHMYHRGRKAARVWKRANKEGLFPLLNLVADEHLERNIRALDADFGDRIKRLDAYAFQHATREVPIERLVGMLLAASFEVLSSLGLQVAYAEDAVRIDSGALLAELDRRGNSFARFVRALRMGLGNRHADPRVDEALELFKGGFRRSDMAALFRVTRRLAELFGSEAMLARGFGGHEGLEWDDREAAIHGEGIDDDSIQREVERILEPPRGGDPRGSKMPGRLQINVGDHARFNRIDRIETLEPNVAEHRAESRALRRYSLRLRDVLARLGLAHVPHRPRLRGRAFDRTRASAVVLRGDPRMLVARELQVKSDLFLGVVIDCSGSMSGANLAKAKRFGVLIAEAARGLTGVDARFFGFTDRVIFDAGDARRCAVTSLASSGGNNDAAALEHVATLAKRSRRRAKLLVMISDGLPTECSVSALRNLVDELSRRHRMCCAQVAVRALAEVCFPHYVVLDEAEMDASVRRFGELVGRLVRRALSHAS